GPAPLTHRGVMVVGGVHGICALDAYNGRTLWIYDQKEYLRDFDGIHHDVAATEVGNHFCIGDDSLFLRTENKSIQLDLNTGKKIAEFETPTNKQDKDQAWGYLAYQNGLLFGSVSNQQHTVSPRYKLSKLYPESVKLFVYDVKTKKMKWEYSAQNSIRNNTIAVGTDAVYLVDRPIAMQDRITDPRRNGRPQEKLKPKQQPSGQLMSMDTQTGKINWKKDQSIFGTQLSVSNQFGVILMTYLGQNHNFFTLPSEVGGRLAAFDSKTGDRLWDKEAEYKTRPLIIDSTIYTQRGAWNLYSGEKIPFKLDRSYGCGQLSASKHMMLFRSATLGYLDLTRDEGVENYGGIRLGCWINAIPAGGLVLIPDASAKCKCSYQMKAWFALQQKQ
ncbi:MAG: PQQ-binding-like beta-propeller repeat protein, partial [Planctomycetaceae bacterium]|nr:PQQ-binding-like beta-propeller repeat protein [Planctomycetaceae bacterium]